IGGLSPFFVHDGQGAGELTGLLVLISGWRILAIGSLECFKAIDWDHLEDRINAGMSSASATGSHPVGYVRRISWPIDSRTMTMGVRMRAASRACVTIHFRLSGISKRDPGRDSSRYWEVRNPTSVLPATSW